MKVPSWVDWHGLEEHVLVGGIAAIAAALLRDSPASACWWMASVGVAHEWGDGDLFWSEGHPWNGLVDCAAFIALPALSWLLSRLV